MCLASCGDFLLDTGDVRITVLGPEQLKGLLPSATSRCPVYAMIDSLGNIGAALTDSEPGKLAQLYRDLALDLRFDQEKRPSICPLSTGE